MGSYPWYEVVEGVALEQGDLLIRLPVIAPTPELSFPLPDQLPVDVEEYDVVVMTQSCDLVQDKIADVILCPHWDIKTAGQMDPSLANAGTPKEIRDGRRHRYTLLASYDQQDVVMGVRIVDFGRIFSLPKSYVQQFAAAQGKRLRLCPPYREHLAQGFARFFMRVGLPQNIEL